MFSFISLIVLSFSCIFVDRFRTFLSSSSFYFLSLIFYSSSLFFSPFTYPKFFFKFSTYALYFPITSSPVLFWARDSLNSYNFFLSSMLYFFSFKFSAFCLSNKPIIDGSKIANFLFCNSFEFLDSCFSANSWLICEVNLFYFNWACSWCLANCDRIC